MKSRKSEAQRLCVNTQKAIAMAPVRLVVASAPHTGAQGFVRCTTNEDGLRERLAKQPLGSCKGVRLRNAFGQRSTKRVQSRVTDPSWANVGNGQQRSFRSTEEAAMAMDRSCSKEPIRRHIEWLMSLKSGLFPKGWSSTTFAETGSVLIHPTWSQLLPEKTCSVGRVSKPKTLERRIAIEGILCPGAISSQIQYWAGASVENVLTKQPEDTESVFARNKPHNVESVSVSAPAATGADSATLHA